MTQSRALFSALAAFFMWVLVDVGMKIGAQSQLPPSLIIGVFGAVGAGGLVATTLLRGRGARLYPTHRRGLALVATASVAINYMNVIALKHLPITMFYILAFTAPFFIVLLSVAARHEGLTGKKITCLVAGFCGVVLAVGMPNINRGDWAGYAAMFVAVTAFSVNTVAIRQLAACVSSESLLLSSSAACGIFGLALSLSDFGAVDSRSWALLIACGFTNVAANALYNKALKHTPSSNVAQLHYTQIISGALFGFLLWHEIPTPGLVAGAALIIASGLVVAAQARAADKVDALDPDPTP